MFNIGQRYLWNNAEYTSIVEVVGFYRKQKDNCARTKVIHCIGSIDSFNQILYFHNDDTKNKLKLLPNQNRI